MLLNKDQVLSLTRDALKIIGMSLVGKGAVSSGQWEIWTTVITEVVGCLLVVGPIIWSQVDHMRTSKVASVAAMPGTTVSPDGKTIHIVDHDLVVAAKEAATPATGKP